MALNTNQAESFQRDVGHQYGDINIYGTAMLGDGHMSIAPTPHDAEEQKRRVLIDDLDYAESGAKRNQLNLTEIGPNSFAWVKETQLSQWLQQGTTPFWISGKPGSGKSTLMRYLIDSNSTQELLDSDGRHWTILHFFYDYRAGGGTANNPVGMLRHFLLQLVRSLPSATAHIDHRQVRQQLVEGSIDGFIDTLVHAVRSTQIRVCAFVDGLDEYDGHLWELCSYLDILRDRTGMKMCLASRPEPDLLNAFRAFPTIAMQDYNDASIKDYISRKVSQRSSLYPSIRSNFSDKISNSLREKAQGVTLWAKLVVDEMLEAYDHSTTEQSLFDLLASFPQELVQLYDRLIERVSDAFRGDAILVLHLVANWDFGIALDASVLFQAVSFIFGKASHQLFFGERADCDAVELHVRGTLGRLLDFVEEEGGSETPSYVRLIHETLATHLRRSARYHQILPGCAEQYDEPSAWLMLAVDVLQCAAQDNAFDVSAANSELQDRLQSRYTSYMRGGTIGLEADSELSRPWSWTNRVIPRKYIKRPDWMELARLLHDCCRLLIVRAMKVPETIHDRLSILPSVLSSDAMTLHFLSCFECLGYFCQLGPQSAKILRLWRCDRPDLICAAIHFTLPYLREIFDSAELEFALKAAVFNLIPFNTSFHLETENNLQFTEQWVNQGGSVNGQPICAILPKCGDLNAYPFAEAAINLSKYSRSGAHDEDCRYYGKINTLMVHWLEASFGQLYSDFPEIMLQSIVQSGVNINASCNGKGSAMELIFDISSTDLGTKSLRDLIHKFVALVEKGAGRSLFEGNAKALSRAAKLRRKLRVYNHTLGKFRGDVAPGALRALDIMVQILKHLKDASAAPEADMLVLMELLWDVSRCDAARGG